MTDVRNKPKKLESLKLTLFQSYDSLNPEPIALERSKSYKKVSLAGFCFYSSNYKQNDHVNAS